MILIYSSVAAIIPMLIYLFFIWKMDKYEPEPIKFVLIHFLWGAFGAIFFGILGSSLLGMFSDILFNIPNENLENSNITSILFAPISEEFAKAVFLIFSSRSKKFDNATDGIVYGAAIGLGFGMTENFLYFISYTENLTSWIYLVIIRSLFSAVMHAISTGIFGAILGLTKYWLDIFRLPIILIALTFSMLIHSFWNFSVSNNQTYLFGLLTMILLISIFIQTLKLAVKNDKKLILKEIDDEIQNNFLPEQAKMFFINKIDIDRTHNNRKILNMLVSLAFSKIKFKKSKGNLKEYYYNEILYYRNALKNFFEII
ncbi:PrsW family intramembrane metalloprotease [Stygiobacter electus]|uniref:PrsW family intramembrane metalloprotease n=1 Tax=Stygiobacter electus TaxID=3032292 RepID=A0AAE3NYN7_9BACT|nr:PrsW family intramembrane metalloprotease [Stygiobacter electus]MDF1612486.1 PrsW family intramembrane metalloprotease [Stygiobacter electus]